MTTDLDIELREFLDAPISDVVRVAPATMIYSVSGTRRRAALAGVPAQGYDYMEWSRQQMMACLDLIFHHGIKHILMPVITPSQFNEATPAYREHLWQWLDWGLAGPEALSDYKSRDWRVHLPFSKALPDLTAAGERLEATRVQASPYNLWIFVAPRHNFLWECSLPKLQAQKIETPAEIIRTLYGEDIPPATVYLDFGKPVVSPDLLPPYLIGVLHCYWSQQPGYSLDQEQLRTILYDFAYVRSTWQVDKTGRAEQVLAHRKVWEQRRIIGLGKRVGPFWYPD
jgi:hypothetical protein